MINPSITLVILTYEQPSYFFTALKSALNQDIESFRLMILDDFSQNFPLNIIEVEEFIKKNKRKNLTSYDVKVNNVNIGIVKSLNYVLKLINTDYYIVLAGDDFLPNDSLRILINHARTYSHDFIIGRNSRITDDMNKEPKITNLDINSKTYDKYNSMTGIERYRGIILGLIPMPSIVGSALKTKAIRGIGGYDEKYIFYEDVPLIVKMSLRGLSFGFVEEITAIYRENTGITSNKDSLHSITLLKDSITFWKEIDSDSVLSKKLKIKKRIQQLQLKSDYLKSKTILNKMGFIMLNFIAISRFFVIDKLIRYLNSSKSHRSNYKKRN